MLVGEKNDRTDFMTSLFRGMTKEIIETFDQITITVKQIRFGKEWFLIPATS
jgi:hypothetical protein